MRESYTKALFFLREIYNPLYEENTKEEYNYGRFIKT